MTHPTRTGSEQTKFNPFIHGTTSIIFSRLAKTQMQLISPIQMLNQYKIAPPGGEIIKGGFDTVGDKGNPSFGILNASGENDYTLEKIIENYTAMPKEEELTDKKLVTAIKEMIATTPKTAFSNINILLIYIARAKANGINIEKKIGKKAINDLLIQAQATTQFFYLIFLLGQNFHPDFDAINQLSSEAKRDLSDAVYTHLTFENILQKIIDNKLNIKAIYEKPTSDGLKKIANLFTLPKKSTIQSGDSCKNKAVTLSLVKPFKISTLSKANYPSNIQNFDDPEYFLLRISQNLNAFGINTLLERFAKQDLPAGFFRRMDAKNLKIIKHMNQRIALLKGILARDKHKMMYSPLEKSFLNNPFPIVLMCEDDQKIKLTHPQKKEFRSDKPLIIGRDIKLIATDTQEHRLMILKFLHEHKINHVKVVFFDQLRQSKNSQKSPESPNIQFGLATSKRTIMMQSLGLGSITSVMIWFMLATNVLFAGVVGMGAALAFVAGAFMRDQYLKYAANCYNSKKKISNVTDVGEKQALLAGLGATTWKGYLNSFTLATCRHPVAFVAAYTHKNNESPIAESIKRHCKV